LQGIKVGSLWTAPAIGQQSADQLQSLESVPVPEWIRAQQFERNRLFSAQRNQKPRETMTLTGVWQTVFTAVENTALPTRRLGRSIDYCVRQPI
jgi:hypothetical protein